VTARTVWLLAGTVLVVALMAGAGYTAGSRGIRSGPVTIPPAGPTGDVTVEGVSVPGGALYFCETATKSRRTALLVRDDVVARVVTVGGTLDRAEQLLRQAVPVAAGRLAAAW
jgi:hypothetical protein